MPKVLLDQSDRSRKLSVIIWLLLSVLLGLSVAHLVDGLSGPPSTIIIRLTTIVTAMGVVAGLGFAEFTDAEIRKRRMWVSFLVCALIFAIGDLVR